LLRRPQQDYPAATVVEYCSAVLKGDYMAPSTRPYMLNFAVDDMDAFLRNIEAKGVKVLKRDDSDPSGKFAWIIDPDGTKIEFWQPGPDR
uniref:VOC family protein n=1 Tax=Rhizorhabdus sp. TaxID=1968843 RepID=UPI0034501991